MDVRVFPGLKANLVLRALPDLVVTPVLLASMESEVFKDHLVVKVHLALLETLEPKVKWVCVVRLDPVAQEVPPDRRVNPDTPVSEVIPDSLVSVESLVSQASLANPGLKAFAVTLVLLVRLVLPATWE